MDTIQISTPQNPVIAFIASNASTVSIAGAMAVMVIILIVIGKKRHDNDNAKT